MRSASRTATAAAIALAVLFACGGCSLSTPRAKSTPARPADGTVAGTLQLTGGPSPGTGHAASGEVYAFTSMSLTGTATATVKTGSGGRFTVKLPPGTYYLAARSPSFSIDPAPAIPPCRGDKPAIVTAGSTSTVDVVCAMK